MISLVCLSPPHPSHPQVGSSTNTLNALKIAFADEETQVIYLLTDGRPDQVLTQNGKEGRLSFLKGLLRTGWGRSSSQNREADLVDSDLSSHIHRKLRQEYDQLKAAGYRTSSRPE